MKTTNEANDKTTMLTTSLKRSLDNTTRRMRSKHSVAQYIPTDALAATLHDIFDHVEALAQSLRDRASDDFAVMKRMTGHGAAFLNVSTDAGEVMRTAKSATTAANVYDRLTPDLSAAELSTLAGFTENLLSNIDTLLMSLDTNAVQRDDRRYREALTQFTFLSQSLEDMLNAVLIRSSKMSLRAALQSKSEGGAK